MSDPNEGEQPGGGRSGWWRPSRKWYLLWLPTGGVLMFAVGIALWTGFNTVLDATNRIEFCISCHEMRDNVYMEYQKTIHYKNPAGVQATCPDCHVPKNWFLKVGRKVKATFNEVPKHFLGYINTREKFISHRQQMADDVWEDMRATDSRECRNCHAMTSMDLENQGKNAKNKHSRVLSGELKKTCVDCHQGIAHTLPEDDKPGVPAPTGAS